MLSKCNMKETAAICHIINSLYKVLFQGFKIILFLIFQANDDSEPQFSNTTPRLFSTSLATSVETITSPRYFFYLSIYLSNYKQLSVSFHYLPVQLPPQRLSQALGIFSIFISICLIIKNYLYLSIIYQSSYLRRDYYKPWVSWYPLFVQLPIFLPDCNNSQVSCCKSSYLSIHIVSVLYNSPPINLSIIIH